MLGGRYTLMVTKAGYVSMSYGQRRPEQQGTVLEIIDGTVVDEISFSLPRGGVITGTILDEFGDQQQIMMAPASPVSSQVEGYTPTCYPGTPNPAEATRIAVRAAQETSNISMALMASRLSSQRATRASGPSSG